MAAPSPSDLQQGVPSGAQIAKRVPAPGGGEYLLDINGGVYAIGGAQYAGSYQDDQYLDPAHRNDPNRQFYDMQLNPEGGYSLISDRGTYDLAPRHQEIQRNAAAEAAKPAPNSLYGDPAYLQFIRTSDLGLETVAENVRRRNIALNSALGLDVGRVQNQGTVSRENISSGHESRGMFRSGRRQRDIERQRSGEGDQLAGLRATATEQMAQGHEQLAGALADRLREAGELGFSTAQQQDVEAKNEELRKKYPLDYGMGE